MEIISDENSTSLSPRRIALFSIGNLCAYPECRQVFEEMNVREIVKKFAVILILNIFSHINSILNAKIIKS